MTGKEKELYSILCARHDGKELSGDEQQKLMALLDGDEEAQLMYFQVERMFHDLEAQYLGNDASELIPQLPVRRAKVLHLAGWSTALAASLVAVLMLTLKPGTDHAGLLVDSDSTVLTEERGYVARVIASEGVEWGAENTVQIKENELTHGMLDLAKGSMDVMFDDGVRLGITAPAQMDLTSLQRLALHSGKVAMDVPGLAGGMVIHTPDAAIRANTARAHLECLPNTPTLVNVEQGSVELFTEDGDGREVLHNLVGSESVKVARGSLDPVIKTKRVIESRIDFSQPPVLEDLKYVHYRFDESRGESVVKSDGNIPDADGWLAGIPAHPEYPGPRKVAGRFNRALQFSGNGEGALADLREFGSDEPGSVAFWIKMDRDVVPGEYENIFTWHMYRDPEKIWHAQDEKELACRIRINPSAAEGVVGAVRIEFRDKWICGTTDLRDGRWHHVTAVFHQGYQGIQVRHYIDGQLARSSARGKTWFPLERYHDVGGGSIAIGRVLWDERPASLAPSAPVGLRGMIDELYVFNQAVLPSHASSLHMKNSPGEMVKVSYVPFRQTSLGFAFPALLSRE